MAHALIEANPAVRSLLALVPQETNGDVMFAGRKLRFWRGRCMEVGPSVDDVPLWEFMRRSQRVDETPLAAAVAHSAVDKETAYSDECEPRFEQALRAQVGVPQRTVTALVRACYVERLAHCLRTHGAEPLLLQTGNYNGHEQGTSYPFVGLMLDALARMAVEFDASLVIRDRTAVLEWLPGPLATDAKQWSGLDHLGDDATVGSILAEHPASPPVLAALLRSGLARLRGDEATDTEPPTPVRTLPPPAPRLHLLDTAQEPVAPELVAQRREPGLRLLPGEAVVSSAPFTPLEPPSMGQRDPDLIDPLRSIELEIEELEREGADGQLRALRWTALSDLWEHRIGCDEESVRALREACAAYPYSTELLQRTASACAHQGDHELAHDYASAAVRIASDEKARRAAAAFTARLYLHAMDRRGAVFHLRQSTTEQLPRPEALEHLAILTHLHGDSHEAAVAYEKAATALSAQPRRACALWASAFFLQPNDERKGMALAASLAAAQATGSAIAVLAHLSRHAYASERRVTLLHEAARRADMSGEYLLAVDALLHAFDVQPSSTVTHQALAEHLITNDLGVEERIAVAQDLANHGSTGDRGKYLALAGKAAMLVAGEQEIGRLLLQRAIASGYSDDEVRNLLGDGPADVALSTTDLAASLRRRLQATSELEEQALLFRRIASIEHVAGNAHEVAEAALHCLAITPNDSLAAARLLRAARAIGDPSMLLQALSFVSQVEQNKRRRSMHLAAMAEVNLAQGYESRAVEYADAALYADPANAQAAWLLLVVGRHVIPSCRPALILQALDTFPGLPPILEYCSTSARTLGNDTLAEQIEQRWSDCAPLDPRPLERLVRGNLEASKPRHLAEYVSRLLEQTTTPEHLELVISASHTMAGRGDTLDAGRILLRALRQVGSRDPVLAAQLVTLAESAKSPPLLARALEHLAHCQTGSDAMSPLQRLASHHRKEGDLIAELRTLIRLLAVAPDSTEAFDRLGELLFVAGDARRLDAVLTLALQTAQDAERRKMLHLKLAASRAMLSSDTDGMLRQLAWLLTERHEDRDLCREVIGVALYLAPSLRSGVMQACQLALTAQNGASILVGLAKTAQLHLQDTALAIQICEHGLDHFPTSGELLLLIEELTFTQRDVTTATRVYDALIVHAAGRQSRRALHYRCGRFLERVGYERKAIAHFASALATAPSVGAVFSSLQRVAERLSDYKTLADAYCLIARTTHDVAVRERYAAWALALARRHTPGDAPQIAAEFGLSLTPQSTTATTASFSMPPEIMDPLAPSDPPTADISDAEPDKSAGAASDESEDDSQLTAWSEPSLRAQVDKGDLVAQVELATRLEQQPQLLDEALMLYLQVIRAEPWRVDALRGLHRVATALHAKAAKETSRQVLLLFSPDMRAQGTGLPPLGSSQLNELEAWLAGDMPNDLRKLLQLLWESTRAMPGFLHALDSYGVHERDLAVLSTSPRLVTGASVVCQRLGLAPPPIYLHPLGQEIVVAATLPCSLIVPKSLEHADDVLVRLARSISYSAPHYACIGTQDRTVIESLLAGVIAAFGPRHAAHDPLHSQKITAASLWEAVPKREQPFVCATVEKYLPLLTYDHLRQFADRASLRATLLFSTDLMQALAVLRPEVHLNTEQAFVEATRRDAMVAELVRSTLSEPYLTAMASQA